ncbi:hypothetical protein ABBQ38_012456 [Trebouxia sp. C0009 RCD-2024]
MSFKADFQADIRAAVQAVSTLPSRSPGPHSVRLIHPVRTKEDVLSTASTRQHHTTIIKGEVCLPVSLCQIAASQELVKSSYRGWRGSELVGGDNNGWRPAQLTSSQKEQRSQEEDWDDFMHMEYLHNLPAMPEMEGAKTLSEVYDKAEEAKAAAVAARTAAKAAGAGPSKEWTAATVELHSAEDDSDALESE